MKSPKLLFFFFLFLQNLAYSNIAQPGMWQAGGMGNYSLLFPEDSLAYKKIQMQKERVSILLYPGYAVVKGEYWMRNDTDSTLTLHTGYPINSQYASLESHDLMQLEFDSLYGLKVLINSVEMDLSRKELSGDIPYWAEGNWYIWENVFPKHATTKIEVYFLMNTNRAKILQGYQSDYHNGFIYLLETGSVWKQPIQSGEIRLKIQAPHQIYNIHGILPAQFFDYAAKDQILRGQFSNLSPSHENNIVINYGSRIKDFDFASIYAKREQWFQEVDGFSQRDLEALAFEARTFSDPFEVYVINPPKGARQWLNYIWKIGGVLLLLFLVRRLLRRRRK